jgi:glycine/D-amino acid oxidase-like deaminating enzyme/nitrite reductase/ring-hydroxylating ferredoxin subunit
MKTISIWDDTSLPLQSYETLSGHLSADVVIIGGGISGLTAALLLSDSGKDVILLEGRKIGLGTTGYSTGNLYTPVDVPLSELKKKWNADMMKAVVHSRQEALNLIEQTISKFQIHCNWTKTTFNYFAEELDKKSEDFFDEEKDALSEAGLHPEILDNSTLPFKVQKILSVGGQAQFHPLKYVRSLAHNISSKCRIFENSAVVEIDEDKKTVKTLTGSVRANHIIMATHVPKGIYPVHTVLGPYREFGVAAQLNNAVFPKGIFWGINDPKHSIRRFDDGENSYIMAIGDKFKTGQAENTELYIQGLKNYLQERVAIGDFKYAWGGQHYRSADGLPYIGKHKENLYFLTGFATDGLIYGTLAAMIVSDQIIGITNKWEETYRESRHTPLKSAKQFIKENTDNIGQYLKDTPWNVDSHTLKDIKAGEAKLVEINNQKLAVYKDEAGVSHIVSAVCTHMKCVVNFNPTEKSWDCPCHGSRFDIDGKVIEGPALSDLPKINPV